MKNENQRSAAHAAAVGVSVADLDRTEFSSIEEIELVEPDDYASRHARLHREARTRGDRAAHLELERNLREACGVKPRATRPAKRVPRDTEPCNLAAFIGMVAGGAAAALVALAAFGWIGSEVLDLLASAVAGVR